MSEKDDMVQPTVVIIGGGAAGLVAAIVSARRGIDVTVLEADARVGRKILASGNGRCNLTNVSVAPTAFNQPGFVTPVLRRVPYDGVREFFGEIGLLVRADDGGRVYPSTNSAASVLDVLRLECSRLGVEVRCDFAVARIESLPDGGLCAFSDSGDAIRAQAAIVATGGGGGLLAQSGHTMVERTPVLAPLKTETDPIRGLSGIRVRCAGTVVVDGCDVATERGELLFREYGVSGIMVFDLSRFIEPGCTLALDLFPDTGRVELEAMLARRSQTLSWRTADTFFAGMLHDRVARALLRAAGIASDTPAETLPADRLAALLKEFRLRVLGIGDARQAQVTRGGASVAEFDAETMASRRIDGLYAAGEVLDVDGRSGGFNLHWAWASGIVAGEAAATFALTQGPGRAHGTRGPA